MAASNETVLITGGGSGIGKGLAEAFHKKGAKVIIAGRTLSKLEAVATACPGMEVELVDVASAQSIADLAARVSARHPNLTTLVNNAGIQNILDFAGKDSPGVDAISLEIDTNLKGLILVSTAFLPLLKRQTASRLMHIGSGLGYVPLAAAPVYSATKAAVHSFTMSLRKQLEKTSVKVIEIIPPVVETELHRGQSRKPPSAMTLQAFVSAAMAGLEAGKSEIPVGLAKVLKVAHRIAPRLFFKIVNKAR
jgi:uncharacterized oxidoreductase